MKKQLFSLFVMAVMAFVLLSSVNSYAKPINDLKILPQAEVVFMSDTQKLQGTFVEGLIVEYNQYVCNQLLDNIDKNKEVLLKYTSEEEIQKAKESIKKNYSTLIPEQYCFSVKCDYSKKDPKEFLKNMDILVSVYCQESLTDDFNSWCEMIKNNNQNGRTEISTSEYKAMVCPVDENKSIACALSSDGKYLLFGTENAVVGAMNNWNGEKLNQEMSDALDNALINSAVCFAVTIPPEARKNYAKDLPKSYRALAEDIHSLTISIAPDKENLNFQVSTIFSNAEMASKMKTNIIDVYIINAGKIWATKYLGEESNLLNSLQSFASGNNAGFIFQLNQQDYKTISALLSKKAEEPEAAAPAEK